MSPALQTIPLVSTANQVKLHWEEAGLSHLIARCFKIFSKEKQDFNTE